jgi:cytochrome c-type biogenesis protein CcmH
MTSYKYLILGFAVLLMFNTPQASNAQAVDEPLADAGQETIARDIMVGVRCLVCQNQSIEDSDADLAVDLRQIIREQVNAGKNKADINQFLIERYGDWILLTPPLNLQTLLLWFGPFVFLSLGGVGIYVLSRKKTQQDNVSDKPDSIAAKDGGGLNSFHIGLLMVALLGATLFLYLSLGKPDLVMNKTDSPEALEQDAELDSIYAELREYVENNPENLEALGRLADLGLSMGRFGDAANAYGDLFAAQPDGGVSPLVLQGEALVSQAQGTVTPAARLTFINVVSREPKHPAARYYLGLWFSQNQDPDRALNIWQQLKLDSNSDAPWMPMLSFQINSILGKDSTDIAQGVGDIGVPSQQAIDDVANMSVEEQQAFIDTMVERLRSRLENNPDDFAGWWRLARVEVERGNIKAALLALEQAEIYAPAIQRGEISAEYMQLEQELEN